MARQQAAAVGVIELILCIIIAIVSVLSFRIAFALWRIPNDLWGDVEGVINFSNTTNKMTILQKIRLKQEV